MFSLGARVNQETRIRHTTIHQLPLIEEIVNEHKEQISSLRAAQRTVPCDPAVLDITKSDPDSSDAKKWIPICLRLGGKLNYIAVFTRPDISAAHKRLQALNCLSV